VHAGEWKVVGKEDGKEERSARGGVGRRSDNAIGVDVEVVLQRCRFDTA